MLSPSQRRAQLPAVFGQMRPGDISLKTHQVVSGATMLPEATLASV